MKLRSDVNKALELARAEKRIGKSLDAEITVYLNGAMKAEELAGIDLKTVCIVSAAAVEEDGGEALPVGAFSGVKVSVKPSEASKCVRCWTHGETDENGLCPRCAAVVKARNVG